MVSIGYCIVSITTATMFRVIGINYDKGMYVIPYSRESKKFLRDELGIVPVQGFKYYKPIECPRSRHI